MTSFWAEGLETPLDWMHITWKPHRGYELHPDNAVTGNMKIAELGTEQQVFMLNSLWLLDLARQPPPTVELHGFDISDDQYPSKELWPKNVKLSLLNFSNDPPASLVGQYNVVNVVHLRMWASVLRDGDTSGIIRHIKQLLKPGGYLQWEDADLVHQRIKGTAEEFERNINHIFKKVDLDYRYVI
ncbi:hypothetical protein N7486_003064 [Penicillium sp. IBT 16267x]|nr:hypothetical protein N7486_003064 [Penicillium sp. IBT 16267x]